MVLDPEGESSTVSFKILSASSSIELRNNTVLFARLINMITLLDCTISFFANFPCRLTLSEMKFDLSSDESLFSAAHPFSRSHFSPSRQLTTYDAFQSLFGQTKCPTTPPNSKDKENPLSLNPMHMFILIHRKYDGASYYCIL